MTTIAYKDGVIAYDSRITSGSRIDYDDYEKCVVENDVKFLMTGSTSDFPRLIEAYFGAEHANVDASAIVLDADKLWIVGHADGSGAWKSAMMPDSPYAMGSGSSYALTAMDMGASAYEAVEMAMKRDSCTGGKIRTLTIKVEQ